MTESFWDLDFETFKKAKTSIDTEIAQLILEIEKQPPAQVDDIINRNEVLVSIRDALGILDKKLQALMRHGVEALSDQDKMVVASALEGVKGLLALMRKISQENLPQDGTLAHIAYARGETGGVPDWGV